MLKDDMPHHTVNLTECRRAWCISWRLSCAQ